MYVYVIDLVWILIDNYFLGFPLETYKSELSTIKTQNVTIWQFYVSCFVSTNPHPLVRKGWDYHFCKKKIYNQRKKR